MSINDPELDEVFNCKTGGKKGFIKFTLTLGGVQLDKTVTLAKISFDLTIKGRVPEVTYANFDSETFRIFELSIRWRGEAVSHAERTNWVGWSKIGEADFELNLSNDAGFRPMEWSGYLFALKQLGNNAIAYGTNGITLLYPVDSPAPTFGFREILRGVGVKSKDAVSGDDSVHFFIDRTGKLWKISQQGVEKLDYSEFLNDLVNPVLFYDTYEKRLLISDSTQGFIYTEKGLGGGYGNLTGFIRDSGAVIVTSPGTIDRPVFSLTTATVDFGQRGTKTITSIQVGTDTPEELELSYDFRFSQGEAFRSTRWVPFNRDGVGFLRCSGIEFRIKVRAKRDILDELFDMHLDYMNINVQFSDNRFKRSASSRAPSREPVGIE